MFRTPATALAHAGLALLCAAGIAPAALAAGCLNEGAAESKVGPTSIAPADAATSRKTLKDLVQAAITRRSSSLHTARYWFPAAARGPKGRYVG